MKLNTNSITLPINLSLSIGAYSTKLYIGSQSVEINVLLDTGSSTLAIDLDKYHPDEDLHLETTVYAQDVVYGSGGWAGPVIQTQVELNHDDSLKLNNAPVAITAISQQQNFQKADGIWGLAYHHLNKAYDVTSFLNQQTPALSSTYPWPFHLDSNPSSVAAFKKQLRSFPEHDITPLFTVFEENNVTPNQFSLLTHRSIVHIPKANMSESVIESDPLNQGQFIIGNDDSYQIIDNSQVKTIQVLHDAYYNTHLQSIRVEGFDPCAAPALDEKHVNSFFSNAIIDSGCSYVVLQKQLHAYLIDCLQKINPLFSKIVDEFNTALSKKQDYLNSDLDPTDWPAVYMEFSGIGGEAVDLVIEANQYWQANAQGPRIWHFMLMNQLPQWPDQSICGLPLMNDYQCIFDRSNGKHGAIHWIG